MKKTFYTNLIFPKKMLFIFSCLLIVSGLKAQGTCDLSITTLSSTNEICPGANNGTITIAATSSNGPITYSISGPVNQSNATGIFTGLPDGNYNILVRDGAFTPGDCDQTTSRTINAGADNTNPTASNPPTLNLGCLYEIPDPDPRVVTDEADNCGPPIVTFQGEINNGGSGRAGDPLIITRTYRVTDASTNFIDVFHTISVLDAILPMITCPGNVSVANTPGQCGANVNYTPPIGTDNCVSTVTFQIAGLGSSAFYPVGSTIETFRVTDAVGNSATCSFTVTVNDTEAPALSNCPSPIVVPNDPGLCSAVVVYTVPLVSDNCPGVGLQRLSGLAPGDPFPVGETLVSYIVADESGNDVSPCNFTVTVNDTEPPTLKCISEYTVSLDTDGEVAILEGQSDPVRFIIDNFFTAYSDNCELNFVSYPALRYNCNTLGKNTARFFADDKNGLVSFCDVTIIVNDQDNNCNQPPNAECKTSFLVEVDPVTCEAFISKDDINNGSSDPDGDPLTLSLDNEGPFSPGTYTVELTAGDDQLEDKCTATVVVLDDTPPVVICPSDITVQCVSDIPAPDTDLLSFSDNCGLPIIPEHLRDESNNEFNPEVQERIYQVTDRFGNMNQCTQTITVEDTTDPEIIGCSGVGTVNADENCQAMVLDYTQFLVVQDNCGTDQFLSLSQSPIAGTLVTGDFDLIVTAVDRSGNTSSCRIPIQFADPLQPSITCPSDQVVQCLDDVPAVDIGTVEADDNCGVAGISHEGDDILGSACNRIITRTYKVIDVNGNENSCEQSIKVEDTTPPVLVIPSNTTIECDKSDQPDNTGNATATDNCSAVDNITIDFSDKRINILGTGCYTIERTWTATDECGKTSSQVQYITVEDTTKPSFTSCPSNISKECNLAIPAPASPEAVDNCDADVFVEYLGEVRDNSCGNDFYTLIRTWRATDNCGNSTSCTQEIKVNTILSDGCFNIALDLSYDASRNTTTFRWELCVEDNKCQDLSNVSFSLPCEVRESGISGTGTSVTDVVVDITGKPSNRNNCKYGITFENFAEDGGIKGESGGCATFYYTLAGDYRDYETDVAIKAGRERGLGFDNVGAACDCDGSVPYNGGSFIADADAFELLKVLQDDPFKTDIARLRAYPNPASANMTIEFSVPKTTEAIIDLYDMQGRRVGRIFEQEVEGGVATTTRIDRLQLQLPQGTYIYRLRAGKHTLQGKLVFLD